MVDLGSRDEVFLEIVSEIRRGILTVADLSIDDGYDVIPMQGSGTFAIESVLSTVVGPDDRLLILVNGAYGKRITQIADRLKIQFESIECPENEIHDEQIVETKLTRGNFTHLISIHCETTTGILNPIKKLGLLAQKYQCQFIVDAMSSFGGIPINFSDCRIDYLVTSSNKCLQGVPGLGIVIARRKCLMAIEHSPGSLSLDLVQQLQGLESSGQFRFTPPTHVVLALRQALSELQEEGGVVKRAKRYQENQQTLVKGMRKLGFKEFISPELQSNIITSFVYPDDPKFDFVTFYKCLSEEGILIYPGKLTDKNCFRIGSIGDLRSEDVTMLLGAMKKTIQKLDIQV